MYNKNNRVVTIVLIFVFIGIGTYLLISSRVRAEYTPNYNLDDFYVVPNRKVGVNEYNPAQVNEEDIVKTYFNTYIMSLLEDINSAYAHLGEKTKKYYPNLAMFRFLVSGLTNNYTEVPRIDRYEISKDGDKQIIRVSDTFGHNYTFTVEAVMKYTVDFE